MDKPQTSMALSSDREEALFRAAVELGPGTARQVFLDQACAGEAALRQRLDALLAAHDAPDICLCGPAPVQAAWSTPLPDSAVFRYDAETHFQTTTAPYFQHPITVL